MIPLPLQTRCLDCGATVPLHRARWTPYEDDGETLHGFLQYAPCSCGTVVVSAIGDSTLLEFLNQNFDECPIDDSPPGYH
jgi:hypothetical protein